MNATQRSTNDQRTVLWDISEGEVLLRRHSGRAYRADLLLVILNRRNDEPWALYRADIRGVVLRKDGSDGLNRADESFWSLNTLPEWARLLVEELLRSVETTA